MRERTKPYRNTSALQSDAKEARTSVYLSEFRHINIALAVLPEHGGPAARSLHAQRKQQTELIAGAILDAPTSRYHVKEARFRMRLRDGRRQVDFKCLPVCGPCEDVIALEPRGNRITSKRSVTRDTQRAT